jgi:hypothetical protein
MNANGQVLDFSGSIEHNIRWVKQLAQEHDISPGMAAQAALMTMTMMDHHRFNLILTEIKSDLEMIRQQVCLLNSSLIMSKPSPPTEEPTSTECSTSPSITAISSNPGK